MVPTTRDEFLSTNEETSFLPTNLMGQAESIVSESESQTSLPPWWLGYSLISGPLFDTTGV